jgi:DNA-binding transcriptional regulator LsrR (DeoR family)
MVDVTNVIITHGNFGVVLLKTVNIIIDKQKDVVALGLNLAYGVETLKENVKNIFEENQILKKAFLIILDLLGESSVPIVGIGSINPKTKIVKTTYFNFDEFLYLDKRWIVGALCPYFLNREASIVRYYYESNVVGTNVEKLKRIPLFFGITGGEGKAETIMHSTLRGSLIGDLGGDEKSSKSIFIALENFVYSNAGKYNGT